MTFIRPITRNWSGKEFYKTNHSKIPEIRPITPKSDWSYNHPPLYQIYGWELIRRVLTSLFPEKFEIEHTNFLFRFNHRRTGSAPQIFIRKSAIANGPLRVERGVYRPFLDTSGFIGFPVIKPEVGIFLFNFAFSSQYTRLDALNEPIFICVEIQAFWLVNWN